MALASGRLRERVVLQTRVLTQDTFGASVESWETLATVWGAVEPTRGREFWTAKQTVAEATAKILIRYRSDVTVIHRAVADGVTWDILSVVKPESRTEYIELYCKEAQP
jgi:SPP1 family predicted phage head-tail adaptor